jgi:hypothetical protein
MNTQTKQYRPLAIGLAAALGLVAGIVIASSRFIMPKLMKGG